MIMVGSTHRQVSLHGCSDDQEDWRHQSDPAMESNEKWNAGILIPVSQPLETLAQKKS